MHLLQHFHSSEHDFVRKIVNWKEECRLNSKIQLTFFLTPREQEIVTQIIGHHDEVECTFFGGFEDSERKRALIHPTYITITNDHFKINCFLVNYNSKFNRIEHRDCLGAMMSLGIDRAHFGDFVFQQDKLYLFTTSEMKDYVLEHLNSIGKAKISLTSVEKYDIMSKNEVLCQKVIVSSMRLDTIVARIYNLSRNQVKEFIMSGAIKVNHVEELNPNTLIKVNDLISVRKLGRCKVEKVLGKTKKDKVMIEISR